ncbi:MAG: hypothetical protein LC118_08665 [Dehalococcoidia bacterium]|nr:hypothetical protein [Dehalococcoidia bacterium]
MTARYYLSIPYGWVEAVSPSAAVEQVVADDPATHHEGVTFLVREERTGHLVVIVVGDDGEPTPVTQDVMDGWDYQFE